MEAEAAFVGREQNGHNWREARGAQAPLPYMPQPLPTWHSRSPSWHSRCHTSPPSALPTLLAAFAACLLQGKPAPCSHAHPPGFANQPSLALASPMASAAAPTLLPQPIIPFSNLWLPSSGSSFSGAKLVSSHLHQLRHTVPCSTRSLHEPTDLCAITCSVLCCSITHTAHGSIANAAQY